MTVLTSRPETDPIVLVELGVRDGSSMEMWTALLSGRNACIIGVDNSPLARDDVPGTYFIDADMTDPDLPKMIQVIAQAHHGVDSFLPLDMVIDDASHDGRQTTIAYGNLFKDVMPGGFYVIEDWYVGGPEWPNYDESMMVVAHDLVASQLFRNSNAKSVLFEYGMIVVNAR